MPRGVNCPFQHSGSSRQRTIFEKNRNDPRNSYSLFAWVPKKRVEEAVPAASLHFIAHAVPTGERNAATPNNHVDRTDEHAE
jgi:hypothetical protein